MSIVQAKYEQLAPQGDFLKDVVVLAQAWKKTHTAIRRHNWYADVLELDCSTIDLERQLGQWAMAVASQTFAPAPMMLVPAPKNARWDFPPPPSVPIDLESLLEMDLSSPSDADTDEKFEAWMVAEDKDRERVQKIRPLAHLSIRDQTLATAVMLCLSDAVESAQGDPSVRDGLKAQKQGIFSYGNRLHCRWDLTTRPRPRAFFSWGNSRTYSQYFQDYRVFLARPRTVCAELSGRLNGARELFIISLDLKSFFDCIDRTALIGQLKALHNEFVADFGLPELQANDDFWCITERIFNWEWRVDDQHLAADVMNEGEHLPTGLPQGLVASGFLANAYMVGFDRLLCDAINTDVDQGGVVIRDYCRYVDDIRLVVEADRRKDAKAIAEKVQDKVAKLLQQHCSTIAAATPLTINENKTNAKPYSSISKENNVSALMELHQKAISGTFDPDSLIQATGGLDGLLWLSEQLEDPRSRKTSPLQLANIAVANTDVREDTVKRFAATRIALALRMRLAMTDTEGAPESDRAINESVNAGAALNHEFEAMARKLSRNRA